MTAPPSHRNRRRKTGTLYVVATPIGNMEDLSARALRILGEVDLVAAEDTRSVGLFLSRLGVQTPKISFFEGNEARRTEELVRRLERGESVAVVSESGTPTVSDPGLRLVTRAHETGIQVVAVPGPCAAVAALSISGLGTDRFLFEGFLPRQKGPRQRRLERLATVPATLILYESPRRLADTLGHMAEVMGAGRRASVCRELTKMHEEVVRGTLADLASRYAGRPPRGEVTVVVEGAPAVPSTTADELDRQITDRLAQGQPVRTIARELSETSGWPRNAIYARAVRKKR